MSGIGIVEEELQVYTDPENRAEQPAGAPEQHQPGHEQQQHPQQAGQEAGGAPGGSQRQPLGDRTAEYWRGYYKPLIEADEAAALASPIKHVSPSLRPGSRSYQPSGSPTKHTPSKGPPPALLHATANAAAGPHAPSSSSRAPLGLPPRSPLPPKHPLTPSGAAGPSLLAGVGPHSAAQPPTHSAVAARPEKAQELSGPTTSTAAPASVSLQFGSSLARAGSGSPLRGSAGSSGVQLQQQLPTDLQQQQQQQLFAQGAWEGSQENLGPAGVAAGAGGAMPWSGPGAISPAASARPLPSMQHGTAGSQPLQQQQQQQQQPAMGLAAMLQQQQQPGSSGALKRGGSPGPESASKVKRGLMFPP